MRHVAHRGRTCEEDEARSQEIGKRFAQDIVRCLKRFAAREIYRHLPHVTHTTEPLPRTA